MCTFAFLAYSLRKYSTLFHHQSPTFSLFFHSSERHFLTNPREGGTAHARPLLRKIKQNMKK